MGVMYTEYLDTILAPQVCIHPLLSLCSQDDVLWQYNKPWQDDII